MSNIFFTSDNHFGHKSILKFCPNTRQGSTVEEMDELMIQKWNSQVSVNDTVYLLGDFSFRNAEQTVQILLRLNGNKHIVLGNHDKWPNGATKKMFFSINTYKEIKVAGQKVILFHFPIVEWNSMHCGSFHLYGHVHGNYAHSGRAMDVGIDARPQKDMGLWEWSEIVDLLKHRPILTKYGREDGSIADHGSF